MKPNFQTKSTIWKHFGFPADDKGRITDKKKTVCRLCQAVVAYTGNTTNLKFHLQWCHAQEYLALQQQDSGDQPGPSRASAVKTTSTQLTISAWNAREIHFVFKRKCEAQAAGQRHFRRFHLPRLAASVCG